MATRLLSLAAALLVVFPLSALAASKNSVPMELTATTVVGSTQLKPGTYKVEWSGNGPNVQLSILKDASVVATAPATLEHSSPYDEGVQVRTGANNQKILQDIYAKKITLKLTQAG